MNYFKKVPEEILIIIFSYLDKDSKMMTTQVCKHWMIIMHVLSWKSISRLAEGDSNLKKDFSKYGWVEDEHDLGQQCRCIDLHLGYYPYKNASWSLSRFDFCTSFGFDEEASVYSHSQSKLIIARTFKTDFEHELYRLRSKERVSTLTFFEIDLEKKIPSCRKVQEIRYSDDEDELHHDKQKIDMKCCEKTLVLLETFSGRMDEDLVRITLWNIENWSYVCTLPLQETINEIFGVTDDLEDDAPNFDFKLELEFQLSSDILVVWVFFDIEDGGGFKFDCCSMILFWSIDASNPEEPSFLTYIRDDVEDVDLFRYNNFEHMYLNAKYFCKEDGNELVVFALDDIEDDVTSNSWIVPAYESCYDNFSWLEDGHSDRFAVIDEYFRGERNGLKLFNIESGECLFYLNLNTLPNLLSDNKWQYCVRNQIPKIMFHLGNLVLMQPLNRFRTGDSSEFCKNRYQFFIVDEMKKNQVVIGAALDFDVYEPEEIHYGLHPKYCTFNRGSILTERKYENYLWKVEN